MRNNFNERFENNANTEITNKSLTKCKEISCPESDYFDDLEELCDRVEKKQKDIKELPKEEDDLFEEKIEESEAAQEDSKKQKHILFSGKVDANGDYGEGGGNQYFIQNARILKQNGNLIPVSREVCRFNPETDRYSSDIRMNEDGYQVHLENRPLMEEDLVQLDESTAHDLKNETALAGDTDLSEEDLKYLDKNTPSTEGLRIVLPGEKQEDFLRPLGNQEDMRGEYHPDGWTNPKELKDGDIYYQLVPGVGNGEKIYSSYFTDKETIDSCRDNDGNIVLSSLMQKLQKQPNMETRSDSDGNSQETYVEEYSIVQYKFKQNPEDT